MSLVFNMVGGGGGGTSIKLAVLSVTKAPTKTAYKAGETFDAAGMVVTATYSNGAKLDNPAYTVAPSGALAVGTTTVTISYSEGGVTKTATQKISVTRTVLTVPAQSGSLTYTGGELSPEWNNYDAEKMELGGVTSGTNAGSYNATVALKDTALYCWPDGSTAAKTVAWRIGKAAGTLTLSKTSVILKPGTASDTLTVTTNSTGAITAESGAPDVVSVKVSGNTVTVESVGNKSGNATVTVRVAEDENHTAAENACAVKSSFVSIYGVKWEFSKAGRLIRTDDAAGFVNPSPAVNNGTGSSPFDGKMPWAGMVRVTDGTAGELVAIPKFWYKWTQTGNSIKLQIADGPADGFFVSPAHMDRGDGKGERDIVYIGRYHCASDYRSRVDSQPLTMIYRSHARTNIHNLGADIWQSDIQMHTTIQMLYLVEFAIWSSQSAIGYGCAPNNKNLFRMGLTDAMQYHTGTTAASLTTFGCTQYRHIEGLWDNACDWMDGCYYNSSGLNIINTPSGFHDYEGGIAVGVPIRGYPSAFTASNKSGLEWVIYPTQANNSEGAMYSVDYWDFNPSKPCLLVGSDCTWSFGRGLFYVGCSNDKNTHLYVHVGCRLQKLP